jgi:hypothetical protein
MNHEAEGRRRVRSPFFVLSSAFLVLSSLACVPARGFTDAQGSAETLARAVLDAIARNDGDRLRRLALSEEEFRRDVWPALPGSRPERNLPLEYVWGDLRQKSDAGLRVLLVEYGGRRFELIALRFDGITRQYSGSTVKPRPALVVRDTGGKTRELRLSGSLIEKGGLWKVFSYIVD